MIERVEISGLRGIQQADVTALTALTILVGPNGCGKSTVLDGIFLGGARLYAIAFAVKRREELPGGAKWLFRSDERPAQVRITRQGDGQRTCTLGFSRFVSDEHTKRLQTIGARRPFTAVTGVFSENNDVAEMSYAFSDDNQSELTILRRGTMRDGTLEPDADALARLDATPNVRLLEPQTMVRPLHDAYSEAVKRGRRDEVRDLVRAVVLRAESIEVLTDAGQPILHLVFPSHSVPVAVAGDGIKSLVRLACELAGDKGETVLLEEPEVHQHPGSLKQSARAILAAVRRGVQVIMTTHSLDLIDLLLSESEAEDLANMSAQRLRLDPSTGVLESSRLTGAELATARGEIQDDLR